jgi:hypothetical protein
MRTVSAILASLAALALLTVPALAKGSDAQQADDKAAPSECHSLQKGPGGAWIEIPCQELGSPARTEHKTSSRSAEQTSH